MSAECDQRQLVRLRIYSEHLAETPGEKYTVTEESRLWSNQAVISYFFDATGQDDRDQKESFVITATKEYAKYANVKFIPSNDRSSANIRITFSPDEKHWVAIGTDALTIPSSKATMNLAWVDPQSKTAATNLVIALHAIGHVLGLVHEQANSRDSSIREYDEDSIMRYSDVGAIAIVGRYDKPQLSHHDKAWLRLNYPKASIDMAEASEDIKALEISLKDLGINDASALKFLATGDVSERRFLYSKYVASKSLVEDLTHRTTLGNLIQRPPDYPDFLLKLQAQLGPKAVPGRNLPGGPPRPADIRKVILDFLQVLRISRAPGSEQSNAIVQALLQLMEIVGTGDPTDELLKETITQEELNALQEQLTAILDRDDDKESPTEIGHGILTELPGMRAVLDWFSRTISENRTHVQDVGKDAATKMLGMLAKNPPQNIFQEIYHLCFASYFVHDINGTAKALQEKHQELLHAVLPEISRNATAEAIEGTQRGEWELVWGPVIWKAPPGDDSGGPDLAWYIAYNRAIISGDDNELRPTYVVAIAGTQTRSVHTWLNSNLDVVIPIDFKDWVSGLRSNPPELRFTVAGIESGGAYLARGTARTVWQLLTERPPPEGEGNEKTLLDFLKSKSQSNPDMGIITTGHSLGGALCPTLAIALVETDVILRDRILTYPIAGPSPGNDAFAKYFADTLLPIPAQPDELTSRVYQVWNFNIVNGWDPVPQAWCIDPKECPKQNLKNIENMFPASDMKSILTVFIAHIIEEIEAKKVRYMPIRSQIFYAPPSEVFKDVRAQHTGAYHKYVGIKPPSLSAVLQKAVD